MHFARDYGTLLLAVALEPREIGQRIKAARDRKGWTQLQFALEANVSPSSVARWEGGKPPPVRELMRVADLLDVPTSELVEDEVTPYDAERLQRVEEQVVATHRLVEELKKEVRALRREPGRAGRRSAEG